MSVQSSPVFINKNSVSIGFPLLQNELKKQYYNEYSILVTKAKTKTKTSITLNDQKICIFLDKTSSQKSKKKSPILLFSIKYDNLKYNSLNLRVLFEKSSLLFAFSI
jgi:hypothetical protein